MTYINELTGFEELTDFEYLEEVSEILSGSVNARNQDGIRFYRDWSGAKYTEIETLKRNADIDRFCTTQYWI